uniref:Kinesin-like protein n=1 Tax=Oncorhynchus kisutch TaxID=8019 RepID=A0A8C7JR99_ONCKI
MEFASVQFCSLRGLKCPIFQFTMIVHPLSKVYCVDNGEPAGSILEFLVPKDLADGFINNKKETYKFRFQEVFDQTVKQEDIFEAIAKPVADSVLSGYNGTIFAYGQTGSGKTFTITGGAERYSDRGIIPRTLSYLYQHFSQDSSMVYTTHISYLEIYNEVGYDLLDPRHEASRLEDLPKVTIMEDPDQNIHLRNLSLHQSANEEEALNLLFLGDTNRMIAETPMNQASTRSHCIFTMHVCGREPGSVTVQRSKLHLVDLAGSERVGKTGVCGQLLTEAKYINLSLHYLEQVIIALSEKNRLHIPYRNSMMTSVLRDSLGGNCMTTMIATVSVDKRNVDESISTCRFAQRVALIRNEALLNEEMDPALLIVSLKREIQCLKEELSMVTGEKREDQLTQEEIHKMEELVKIFLEDPDCEVTLALGPDMRKIHYCFSLLKVLLTRSLSHTQFLSGGDHPDQKDSPQLQPADLTKLREMLTQRDNEISILPMLQPYKYYSSSSLSSVCWMETWLVTMTAMWVYCIKMMGIHDSFSLHSSSASKLSMGKQEAFEIFRRDHEDRLTIEDNKSLLKQRSEGKGRPCWELQFQFTSVTVSPAEVEEVDPVEENIRRQMDEEKKSYKSTFGHLKTLKMEIEHLQLLLERSTVKLQRDFQDWWSQEAARLQVTSLPLFGMARGQSSIRTNQSSESSSPSHPMTRALSSTELSKSFFPLTGDQQTDADILGFIRARHNLLNRTGTVHTI